MSNVGMLGVFITKLKNKTKGNAISSGINGLP